ncbi:hypothetical protein Krac_4503 [Ktedonobacter racemifer DSM 44963]|uniref:Uncharacterized protein n=1 Tax=Ktedonobacter racemifer DSM 44963 TaxID=485913 RepID=D6TSX6_KTERA|nr:hypothetical protein Krac_4503 [Ktedonobacter racemifer DSM 44963]
MSGAHIDFDVATNRFKSQGAWLLSSFCSLFPRKTFSSQPVIASPLCLLFPHITEAGILPFLAQKCPLPSQAHPKSLGRLMSSLKKLQARGWSSRLWRMISRSWPR